MTTLNAKRSAPGKIGVVCAPIPSINPGMVSVDLAFRAFSQRHGHDDVEYFHLFDPAEYMAATPQIQEEKHRYYEDYPIRYQRLLGNLHRLLECNVIVFWGDWTHMAVYCQKIIVPSLVTLKICANELEAQEFVGRYFFFVGQPRSVFDKTFVFGETMLFNSAWDEIAAYGVFELESFVTQINNLYMRDVYSAAKIRRLRQQYDRSFQGVDCAMLLTKEDNAELPRALPPSVFNKQAGDVAVYFGRSNVGAGDISTIAATLTTAMGTAAFWLPWGSSFAFPHAKAPLFPLPAGMDIGDLKIGDQMHLIEHASVVVTDTYHVCINAWRMGVPAICVGGSLAMTDWDVNSGRMFASHDKRFALFAMIDALDFFIHEAELTSRSMLEAHLAHIAMLLTDTSVVKRIAAEIRSAAAAAESGLAQDISAVLNTAHRRTA